VISQQPLLSDSEHKTFTLQLALRNGRVQISVHIMRSVIRLHGILASGVEFTRRQIGFRGKFR
jgi:hypothetical protein